jgi:hypothetical protein
MSQLRIDLTKSRQVIPEHDGSGNKRTAV